MPARTTKRESRTESHATSYEEFFRSLSLLGLAVAEAQYRVDRGAYFEKEDQQQTIKFSAEQSDLGKKHFDVSATLKLTSGGEKDETVLSIAVTYLMHLHTKEPILEEHVKRFTSKEVRLIIWPYLREFVTSACAKMYIPPIFLPLPGEDAGE